MCRRRVGGAEELGTLIAMVDEPTEIFDDLYLGLRAGGAMRKKRRGEPLTMEEEEALGRWESLSGARKAATIGAFAESALGATLEAPGILNNDLLNFLNTAIAALLAIWLTGLLT